MGCGVEDYMSYRVLDVCDGVMYVCGLVLYLERKPGDKPLAAYWCEDVGVRIDEATSRLEVGSSIKRVWY